MNKQELLSAIKALSLEKQWELLKEANESYKEQFNARFKRVNLVNPCGNVNTEIEQFLSDEHNSLQFCMVQYRPSSIMGGVGLNVVYIDQHALEDILVENLEAELMEKFNLS